MKRAAIAALFIVLAGCSAPPCTSGPGVAPSAARSAPAPSAPPPHQDEPPPIEPARWSVIEDTLNARRTPKRNTVAYVPLTDAEDQAYRAWVRAAARAAAAAGEPPAVTPDGFTLERVFPIKEGSPSASGSSAPGSSAPGSSAPGSNGSKGPNGARGTAGEVWLLAEHPDRRHGTAAILLRSGAAHPLLVEAPHTFHDVGTLPLAAAIFEVQRARALLINTVHRRTAIEMASPPAGSAAPPRAAHGDEEDEPQDGASASDFAHAPRSSFLSAHEELLGVYPRALALQLHGFADRSAPDVQIIVSAAGTAADTVGPAAAFAPFVSNEGVRRYPDQIKSLGGTTNVAARSSRAAGAPLLHLELSRTFRDELSQNLDKRGQFAAALPRAERSSPR